MKKQAPPAFFTKLLRWYCRDSLYNELQGDLEESFHLNVKIQGLATARKRYRREVIHLIRPSVLKQPYLLSMKPNHLLTHYTKVALRNFWQNKTHTGISLLGLTLGITTSVLIFQFNKYEESYDGFHTNSHNIYHLQNNVRSNSTGETIATRAPTFYAAHQDIQEEIPEIVNSTHIYDGTGIFTFNEDSYKEEDVLFAPSTFFEMFPSPWWKETSRILISRVCFSCLSDSQRRSLETSIPLVKG